MARHPLANKKNLKKKGDYGVRVAKYGYDASNCADNELLFNSNWPIIQIAKVLDVSEPILIGSTPYPTDDRYELINEEDITVGAVDRRYAYSKVHMRQYYYGTEEQVGSKYIIHSYNFYQLDLYGKSHNLGYAPMFFGSGDFSDIQGKAILTNIHLADDIDYPYTSKPMKRWGGTADYGIRSKAYYSGNFPRTGSMYGVGLDTNIQGKMVQAVKTEKSLADGAKTCRWYPPEDGEGEPISEADEFEYYSFVSNLAIWTGFNGFEANGGMGGGDEYREIYIYRNSSDKLDLGYGPIYYRRWTRSILENREIVGAEIIPADNYAGNVYEDEAHYNKQSLVVLRSPMVAPDLEEVEVF